MTKRVNTAVWNEKQKRWRINVQKDGVRRTFYSFTPGRTGQREANAKADAWLDTGVNPISERVRDAYKAFQEESQGVVSTREYNHIDTIGRVWVKPYIGKRKIADLCDGDIQRILDKAAAMGRSKKAIQDINGIINRFLKWCRRNKKPPIGRMTCMSRPRQD